MKLQAFNSSYFHGKIFFGYDGSQNIFVYHPKINVRVKKNKGTDYIVRWKSKELYASKINPF